MSSTRPNRILPLTDQKLDLKTLRALVGAVPNIPSMWIKLATALEAAGQTSEALAAWRRAGLLVPNSAVVVKALSRLSDMDSGEGSAPVEPAFSHTGPLQPTELQADSSDETGTDNDGKDLDIDALITDLQSGRREPTVGLADVDNPLDQTVAADLVVSETLARIYEAQNHFDEAVKMYETLADREKDVNKADVFRARAADLRKRMSKSG